MDKSFIIKFTGINKDYQSDVAGELEALLNDVVEFAEHVEVEEIDCDG